MTSFSKARIGRAIPISLVLIVIVVGLIIVAGDRWRLGSGVLAGAAALGALLRLVLPTSAAGVLAVRSRAFDVVLLALLAVLLAGMALIAVTPHN